MKEQIKYKNDYYQFAYNRDLKRELQEAKTDLIDILSTTEDKRLKLSINYILNNLEPAESNLFIIYTQIANNSNKTLSEIFKVNGTTLRNIIYRIKNKIEKHVIDNI